MLAIDKNKHAKKELDRFKHALKGMENYLSRMSQGIDEIHHCGYVATAPMGVTQTVQKVVNPQDELDRDFQMVFRFDITGEMAERVTFSPLYKMDGPPRPLGTITCSEIAVVEWFLAKGIYLVLTDLLQELVNTHNEAIDRLKKDVETFHNWSENINVPECTLECAVEEEYGA